MSATTSACERSGGEALADDFRLAMRRFAAAVTVVTTGSASMRCGITATAVTSLSMEPPALVVCLNRGGLLRARLSQGSVFCVNVLTPGHVEVSRAFAGGTPHEERFSVGDWGERDGVPYLSDAQCAIFCEATDCIEWTTHTIIICEARSVHLGMPSRPLIYCAGGFRSSQPIT